MFLYFIPVLAPMVIYSWLALRWAIGQFQREEVLFREAERLDLGLWLKRLLREKEALPSAGEALFCFALILGLRWLSMGVFAKLDWIGAQNEEYRQHFENLGAINVLATGNIKYDGVNMERRNARIQTMRILLGISADSPVWVAGSTQAPEESIAIDIYRRAKVRHPRLRLILVPRHPERFEEVAWMLERSGLPFVRRSTLEPATPIPPDAVILGDTMGELSAIWGLADLAFVGGSLDGKRGGQNMLEPAAYGAMVLFGPHVWNFRETAARLAGARAACQVAEPDGSIGRPSTSW